MTDSLKSKLTKARNMWKDYKESTQYRGERLKLTTVTEDLILYQTDKGEYMLDTALLGRYQDKGLSE